MTLVKDLIKDSIWMPSEKYGMAKPVISILFPTYCRKKSGLLKKSLSSLLNQSFVDFELIIIDDASSDGTEDYIKSIMGSDSRISIIRHTKNVGLPGISILEGFFKAQGKYIFFGFDDCIYDKHALKNLHNAILKEKCDIVAGCVKLGEFILGQANPKYISKASLLLVNTIPNPGVLIKKTLFEKVGWYDPHVIMARNNDWDLWKRILEYTDIVTIPTVVADEHGPFTLDSLGNTRVLNQDAVNEYSSMEGRVENLRLKNILEYKIDDLPSTCSLSLKFYLYEILKFNHRHLLNNENLEGYIYVACNCVIASVSLPFDALENDLAGRIRYVSNILSPDHYINASAIILTRPVFAESEIAIIQYCQDNHVPLYLYLDDNSVLLAQSESILGDIWRSSSRLNRMLKKFTGVLLTSQHLIDFFINNGLIEPQKIHYVTPIIQDFSHLKDKAENEKTDRLNIAFLGGLWRNEAFLNYVWPALLRLSKIKKINLYIPENIVPKIYETRNLKLCHIRYELYYKQFISQLYNKNIDIIVHPMEEHVNAKYKTLNVLLNAYHLNAVPLVSDLPPYSELKNETCVVLCNEHDWYNNILKYAEDKKLANQVKMANAKYVEIHFSPKNNSTLMRKILEDSPFPGIFCLEKRLNSIYKRQITQYSFKLLVKKVLSQIKKQLKSKAKAAVRLILYRTYLIKPSRYLLSTLKKFAHATQNMNEVLYIKSSIHTQLDKIFGEEGFEAIINNVFNHTISEDLLFSERQLIKILALKEVYETSITGILQLLKGNKELYYFCELKKYPYNLPTERLLTNFSTQSSDPSLEEFLSKIKKRWNSDS